MIIKKHGKYKVSQKFIPLISCVLTFDQNLSCMKFLKDVYCSIGYMYSEFQ